MDYLVWLAEEHQSKKIHPFDWSNAPGTKEVLVYVDAYRDLSFAQKRNRSDLFLTAGVLCKRVRRRLSRRGGWMSSVDGGGGSGAWISRGFSAEAPLALSSGDSWGNLDNGFSLIDAIES